MRASVHHHADLAAVQFVPVTLGEFLAGIAEQGLVLRQPFSEGARETAQMIGVGQPLSQFHGVIDVGRQYLAHLQAQGQRGRGRFDERVAVPVATDP